MNYCEECDAELTKQGVDEVLVDTDGMILMHAGISHVFLAHRRDCPYYGKGEPVMAKFLERLIKVLPYPAQIAHLQIRDAEMRFSWRGGTYRVSQSGSVEEVEGGFLLGTNAALLLEELLKEVKHQGEPVEEPKSEPPEFEYW